MNRTLTRQRSNSPLHTRNRVILLTTLLTLIAAAVIVVFRATEHAGEKASPSNLGPTPVSINGGLRVCGTQLCNRNDRPVQLRGVSTHGLQWFGWGRCLSRRSINALAKNWKAGILRVAVYVKEGGYGVNPERATREVDVIIEEASRQGMYVLVDWHVQGDPRQELTRAVSFFSHVARKHAYRNSILYELANEPSGVTWNEIKSYSEQLISAIRQYDRSGVIIVPTPGWSSLGVSEKGNAQEVVAHPILTANVMYAFHFYAATHKAKYIRELSWASYFIPMFVTEWGTQSDTGDGANDFRTSQEYVDLMESRQISWTNWNYSDDQRSGAVFRVGTCPTGPFTGTTSLKPAGTWVRERIRGD